MKEHTVQISESLSTIAAKYGVKWKDLYNHPENEEFKKKRPNPNIIFPGDVINIPDPTTKNESLKINATNTFQMKVPKTLVNLLLKDENREPLSNRSFTIFCEKDSIKPIQGKTDADGRLKEKVKASVKEVLIEIEGNEGENPRKIKLNLHALDPITTETGFQSRMKNLGYYNGKIDGDIGDKSQTAIESFQEQNGLKVDGYAFKKTLEKLMKEYQGS